MENLSDALNFCDLDPTQLDLRGLIARADQPVPPVSVEGFILEELDVEVIVLN